MLYVPWFGMILSGTVLFPSFVTTIIYNKTQRENKRALSKTKTFSRDYIKQDQMNLDLWPWEKTIQVQSNRYFAIKTHKKMIQIQSNHFFQKDLKKP